MLLFSVESLEKDWEQCRSLFREHFCADFIDGNVDESDMVAFKTVDNTIANSVQVMKEMAELLTEIDNKLDRLLKKD